MARRSSPFAGPPGGKGGRNDAGVLLQQAHALHRQGQLTEAEPVYRRALKLAKRDPQIWSLFGRLLNELGRRAEAVAALQKAIQIDESNADHHFALGVVLLEAARPDAARAALRRAAGLDRRSVEILFNLAMANEGCGDDEEAESLYRRCVAMDPRQYRAWSNLARLLARVARPSEALDALALGTEASPKVVPLWGMLANIARQVDRHDLAIDAMERIIALRPKDPDSLVQLADVLRECGRLDEAITLCGQAIEFDADHAQARMLRTNLRRPTERDEDVAWLERHAASDRTASVPTEDLSFALASAYARIGEDDLEFATLANANRAKRAKITYSSDDDRKFFDSIRAVFDAEFVAARRGAGAEDPTPIFVFGMPRSGTTLVEQILASHSSVHGAGELEIVRQIASNSEEIDGLYPENLRALDHDAFAAAGLRYIDRVRLLAPNAERITDKMPMNFVYLGLIRLMLPEARLVHCVRDPRDNGLSIWRQNFGENQPFAYELREIARFSRMHDDLMAHWASVFGADMFLSIRYEDVVQDLEAQARRLLDWCGLEWEDTCLSFHENRRAVRTASYAQVRQPVYRSSVAAWERYREHLAPMIEELAQ